MDEIVIKTETIRLGQFLKLAGLALEGGEARELLAAGMVRVNGQVETRRGRKLQHGDVVEHDKACFAVRGQPDGMPPDG